MRKRVNDPLKIYPRLVHLKDNIFSVDENYGGCRFIARDFTLIDFWGMPFYWFDEYSSVILHYENIFYKLVPHVGFFAFDHAIRLEPI
jgi:hypothetical protein